MQINYTLLHTYSLLYFYINTYRYLYLYTTSLSLLYSTHHIWFVFTIQYHEIMKFSILIAKLSQNSSLSLAELVLISTPIRSPDPIRPPEIVFYKQYRTTLPKQKLLDYVSRGWI